MPVIEPDTLESISDEPIAQALSMGCSSIFVFVNRSAEVFWRLTNQANGATAPTH